MNIELLKECIADAKATKLLVLSWNEGIFWGTMAWDDFEKETVKRVTCHCRLCNLSMSLEASSSHDCIDNKEYMDNLIAKMKKIPYNNDERGEYNTRFALTKMP